MLWTAPAVRPYSLNDAMPSLYSNWGSNQRLRCSRFPNQLKQAVLSRSLMDGGDLPPVQLPAAALLLLAVAVPVAFAGIVSVPARLLARQPVAPLLAYE
jgi:hypothetical protein